MISSLNYASPSFMAQQAVKAVPAKDQKPVNAQKPVAKPIEKAPAKKADKKQKTGKGAMIGMALVTAGSLFYGIKKGSALKKMTAAADELKRNLTNVSDELKDLKAEVAAKEAKKLVNRIKNFFSKKA